MRGKKLSETWAPGLFLALDQHADIDGKRAALFDPGARRLDEGHQLAFVVRGAARDDDPAIAYILGQARLERRRGPFIQGIRWLDVVMAIEQHMRARALGGLGAPMPDHHRLAQCGLDTRRKSDLAEGTGAPFRRGDAEIREKRGRWRRWVWQATGTAVRAPLPLRARAGRARVAAPHRYFAIRSSPWSAAHIRHRAAGSSGQPAANGVDAVEFEFAGSAIRPFAR